MRAAESTLDQFGIQLRKDIHKLVMSDLLDAVQDLLIPLLRNDTLRRIALAAFALEGLLEDVL